MQSISAQLTLGLNLKDEATFDHFYQGGNAEIVAALKKMVLGVGDKIIYLSGTKGQGRSHLLQACCHYAYQHKLNSVYLPFSDLIKFDAGILKGIEYLDVVCLDDLELIAKHPIWEEAVFHLYNRIYDAGGRIVLAGMRLPNMLGLMLPDLSSRLSWGVVYTLTPLSDDGKLELLMKRAQNRGMILSQEVAKYILTHYYRDLDALFIFLDILDKASLAAKRRLTVPFVKEVFEFSKLE